MWKLYFSSVFILNVIMLSACSPRVVTAEESIKKILRDSDLRDSVRDVCMIGDQRESSFVFEVRIVNKDYSPFVDRAGFSVENDATERYRIIDNAVAHGYLDKGEGAAGEILKGLDASGLWMEVILFDDRAIVFANRM
jgi:hypothetical protein